MASYIFIGIVASLAYILHRVLQEKHPQKKLSEIVIAKHFVPWVGSPFRYATIGPRAFLLECSQKLGPIFGFNVFGQRVIMISSLNVLKEVFKHDRNGSFTVILGQQMHTMAGYSASQQRYEYIYTVFQQKAFRPLYHAFSIQEIHRRAPHINSIIQEQIQTTLRNTGSSGLSIIHFTRHIVHQSNMNLLFGLGMPDIFEDDNTLDMYMATIMYGMKKFVPSAVRARERVYNTLAKHLSDNWVNDGDGYLEGASDFMSDVIREMKSAEFTPEEIARYIIPLIWGATSNIMSICTWAMGQIISDIDFYKTVVNEVRLATDNLNPDELIDMDPRDHSFPYLDSVIQECLRTKTQVPLMRVAREDVVILDEGREIHIHKGDFVAPAGASLNMSAAYFDEPHSFKPERFVDSPEGKALYVFGAGQHSCAGRHLAMHVIRMVVILTLRSFDIRLNPTSDKSFRENAISFASFVKIANDLIIDISRRSDEPRSCTT